MGTVYHSKIKHLIPFKESTRIETTESFTAAITAGSARRLELRKYRGVTILGVELIINEFKTTHSPAGTNDSVVTNGNYGISLYAKYNHGANNDGDVVKCLNAPIYTAGSRAFGKTGGTNIVPMLPIHRIPATGNGFIADPGFGGTDGQTTGTGSSDVVFPALGYTFGEVAFGLDVIGGTAGGGGFNLDADLIVYGFCNGSEMIQPSAGKASFADLGSAVAFTPTTADFTSTLPTTEVTFSGQDVIA